MSNINLCAARSTSSKLPFEKKVMAVYMNSLINSTDIQDMLATLKTKTTLSKLFWLPQGVSEYAIQYMDYKYQSIIAYSHKKKNTKLFNMIAMAFFTGICYQFRSEEYLSRSVTETDPEASDGFAYTDYGVITDAPTGMVYQVFINNYVLGDTEIDGVQTYDELLLALEKAKYFIEIVKPAHVNIRFTFSPYCKLGSSLINSTEQYSTGATVISGPFTDSSLKTEMASLSDEKKQFLYNAVSPSSIEILDGTLSRATTSSYIHVKMILKTSIQPGTEPEDYWGDIIVTSIDPSLKKYNLTIHIDDSIQTSDSCVFACLSIYVPLE